MKRLLLDTHALLWWLVDSPELGASTRRAIADSRNSIYVSAASVWEISIKKPLGKVSAPEGFQTIIEEEGFTPLPIDLFHGEQAGTLPPVHRDPFDRILVAQAQAEGMVIVTADGQIPSYGVRTMNARL